MMSSKAKLNFSVDSIILVAFVLTAVSGILLWVVLPHGGFQGGRNALYYQRLVLSRAGWLALHEWAGLVVIGGVAIHFLLHWDWLVCMTRRLLGIGKRHRSLSQAQATSCPLPE
jgi:cytochrome b subunit of formate dehydrogenase